MADSQTPCIARTLIARADDIVRRLHAQPLTVVTAESCTAGLISAVLSQTDGASTVLHGSFVTYTKLNKEMALGVDAELLQRSGSVNAEVACQLACGALERSPADIALRDGVLGPEPDEDGNPVGLVFFCCYRRSGESTIIRKKYGNRPHDRLRRIVVLEALALIEACISTAHTIQREPQCRISGPSFP